MFSTEHLAKQKHVFAENGHLQLLCSRCPVVIFHFSCVSCLFLYNLTTQLRQKSSLKRIAGQFELDTDTVDTNL